MMGSSLLKIITIISIIFCVDACYYDNEQTLYHPTITECTTINAKFTTNVMPIITSNCATPSCHNSTGAGGVILTSYDQIFAKLDRIRVRVLVDKTMPPNGSLTSSDLSIIQCWITAGGPNN